MQFFKPSAVRISAVSALLQQNKLAIAMVLRADLAETVGRTAVPGRFMPFA